MKKFTVRALQSIGLLAIVWVIARMFLGANAALGVVLILLVAGLIGTLITLD